MIDLLLLSSPPPNSGIYQPSTSTTKGSFTGILPLLTITHSVYGRFLSLVSWSSTVWTTDCQRRSRLETFFLMDYLNQAANNTFQHHITVDLNCDIYLQVRVSEAPPTIPSRTLPKTTCFPSSHGALVARMKNCDPLVSGPAFAILTWYINTHNNSPYSS